MPRPQGSFYAHADVAPPAHAVKQNDDADMALKEAAALEALLEGAAEALSRGDNSRGAFTSLRARPRPPVVDGSPAARPSSRVWKRAALELARRAAQQEQGEAGLQRRRAPGGRADLGFTAGLTLAAALAACELWSEALAAYQRLMDGPAYPEARPTSRRAAATATRAPRPSRARRPQAKRLRVNVGNIHFARGDYAAAVRLYRMAADALPPGERGAPLRINRNVGAALLRMGQLTARPGAGPASCGHTSAHQRRRRRGAVPRRRRRRWSGRRKAARTTARPSTWLSAAARMLAMRR